MFLVSKKTIPLFTPNQITVFHLLLLPLIVIWWYVVPTAYQWLVAPLFFLSFILDIADGYIARKYKLTSEIGGYLDLAADKIGFLALFVVLLELGYLPIWFIFAFFSRDFIMTIFRQIAQVKRVIIHADKWGKRKQDLLVFPAIILFALHYINFGSQAHYYLAALSFVIPFVFGWRKDLLVVGVYIFYMLLFVLKPTSIPLLNYFVIFYIINSLILTWGSALHYFWKYRKILKITT